MVLTAGIAILLTIAAIVTWRQRRNRSPSTPSHVVTLEHPPAVNNPTFVADAAADDSYEVAHPLNPQCQSTLLERLSDRAYDEINLNVAGVAGHPDRNQDEHGYIAFAGPKGHPNRNQDEDGHTAVVGLAGNPDRNRHGESLPADAGQSFLAAEANQTLAVQQHRSDGNQNHDEADTLPPRQCAYLSTGGRICQRRRTPLSRHCAGHTCAINGCAEPKSSKEPFCAAHSDCDLYGAKSGGTGPKVLAGGPYARPQSGAGHDTSELQVATGQRSIRPRTDRKPSLYDGFDIGGEASGSAIRSSSVA